jgi:UDP-glucose 4-epimerase
MGKTKVLVTGAAGFMGSHVADHCLALGMDVVATDDLSGGIESNVPTDARWLKGDLRDPKFTNSLWDYGPFDYVYHLAAYAAEGLSHFIRRYNYHTNLIASVNLINQAVTHEVKCFVFTSSIAVYGRNQVPMREDMTPQPEDPYGISKYAVELDLKAAKEMFGLDFIIFRPHNVYGERQNIADKYRNVVGIFMNQILQDKPMTIFGDGLQTRAFSHIDNVAPLISQSPLVPEAMNEVFNVGADIPSTVLQLAEQVAAAFDKPSVVEHLPPRKEVVNAFADHSKVKSVFDPIPPVSLRTGIQKMASWVRSRGPSTPVVFNNIEVAKNLPGSWK